MKKGQGLLLSAVFCLTLLAGGLGLLLLPKQTISEAERRPLAEPPTLSAPAVLDGSFFRRSEAWVTDHFPAREVFRGLKAFWQLRVMGEPENNGLTMVEGSVVKLEKQINDASLAYAGERLQAALAAIPGPGECRLYYALIPDKSHYLQAQGYPVLELEQMEKELGRALPGASPIPLAELLELSDYYRTDPHWRQERLLPAAARLLEALGRGEALSGGKFRRRSCGSFRGAYAGQWALPLPEEEILCLEGEPIADCFAVDLETGQRIPLYDPEGCDPRDRYTLFLGGSKGLLRLENPAVTEPGELIVFRDSFGSSIAPLLCSGYRRVTLIDLRYVSPAVLRRYLRLEGQDVLFLFSVTLLNQSQGLR